MKRISSSKKFFIFSDYPEKWLRRLSKEGFRELYLTYVYGLIDAKEGEKILEVGVGEGRHIRALCKTDALFTGIDISHRMVKYAWGSLRDRTNVNFCVCDAEYLPFRDAVFDKAFCLGTFFFIPNQFLAIREMARVTVCTLVIEFRNKFAVSLAFVVCIQRIRRILYRVLSREKAFKPYNQPFFPTSLSWIRKIVGLADLNVDIVLGFGLPGKGTEARRARLNMLAPVLLVKFLHETETRQC